MVHKMAGVYRAAKVPVLIQDGKEAVNNQSKVDMLVKTFQTVHSSGNINISKNKMEEKLRKESFKLEHSHDNAGAINIFSQCKN